MGLYGSLYGASTSSGGGPSPVTPSLTIPTTAQNIRDRIIAVIAALTPVHAPIDRFIAFRNERDAAFFDWAETHADGCRRRFQVRRIADTENAAVSNNDIEERLVTFRILISYAQTSRDGKDGALDRDDTMDDDLFQIEKAIGMNGRANLAPPYPDACWRPDGNGTTSRIAEPITDRGRDVDFGVIYATYAYQRVR